MNLEIRDPRQFFKEIRRSKTDEMIEACRDRNVEPEELQAFLVEAIGTSEGKDRETLAKLYRGLMEAFGLPWETTPGRSMLYDVTMVNKEGSDDPVAPFNHEIPNFFAAVADLENVHEGSARFLLDKYGIRAFHRYGTGILARQFEQHDADGPYGIVLALHRDDGNGFSTMHEELDDVDRQLPQGVKLRVMEAGNAIEAVRRLVAQHRRFPNQAFRFAIVETHTHGGGNLVFGADQSDDPTTGVPGGIRPEHLTGMGGARIGSYFAENAPVILTGCKSARHGGIAEALQPALGRPVFGAEGNTTLAEITFRSWSEDLVPAVDVKYFQQDKPVPTKVFPAV